MALSIYSPLCQLTPSDNTPAVPVPPGPVESLGEVAILSQACLPSVFRSWNGGTGKLKTILCLNVGRGSQQKLVSGSHGGDFAFQGESLLSKLLQEAEVLGLAPFLHRME